MSAVVLKKQPGNNSISGQRFGEFGMTKDLGQTCAIWRLLCLLNISNQKLEVGRKLRNILNYRTEPVRLSLG